jgi:O-antigen/teichoic acid export membrane protein
MTLINPVRSITKEDNLGLRRLISDSAVVVLAQGVSLFVVLVLTPFELSGMGTERYGLCALAAASASYVTLFDVGGGWAVMRFIPLYRSEGRRREADEAFSVALLVSLTTGLSGALTLFLAAKPVAALFNTTPGMRTEATEAVRIAGLWLPALLVLGVLIGAGQALGRFRMWAWVSAGSVIAFNVLWLVVARTSRSPVQVMWSQVAITVLATAFWAVLLSRDSESPKLCLPRRGQVAAQLIRFSALSSVAQSGVMLLVTVGTIVVSYAVGAASIVYYALPMSFAQRLTIISSTVVTVLFPKISRSRGGLRRSHEKLINDSHLLVAVITSALSAILLWAGNSGLAIWISPAFAGRATGPLAVLAIGFGAVSMSSVYYVNMEAAGRVAITALLTAGSGVLGVAAALLLALPYGELGGAVGITIGLVVLSITVTAASAYFERTPSRREIGWTGMVALAIFAIGAATHFAVRAVLRPSTGSLWADVLITSTFVGVTAILLGRKLIGRAGDVAIEGA